MRKLIKTSLGIIGISSVVVPASVLTSCKSDNEKLILVSATGYSDNSVILMANMPCY
jgi:hypothetical protein